MGMGPPTRHAVLISDVKLFVTLALNSLIFNFYKHTSRDIKRDSFSGFRLILTDFGLNGPDQKSPGLNGLRKLRT